VNSVLQALGLTRNPFPPTPDAESYFYTPELESELAELQHCIQSRKGFVLVTGEVGLGKSTLVRRLLAGLEEYRVHSALVLNTFLQDQALQDAILRDFGLPTAEDVGQGLETLNQFLLQRHREGITCLLVIDDAQNLTPSSLELVRLMCNLETAQEKLLQILLVGQPELETTLAQPELRQLKSRIIKHTRLNGLTLDELIRYFDFRVNAAGGNGRLTLAPGAARLLHGRTAGNLRRLHLVLDRCLYGLVGGHTRTVDETIMRRALADVPELGGDGVGGLARAKRIQPWRAMVLGAGLGLASMAAWGAWQWWQGEAAMRRPMASANSSMEATGMSRPDAAAQLAVPDAAANSSMEATGMSRPDAAAQLAVPDAAAGTSFPRPSAEPGDTLQAKPPTASPRQACELSLAHRLKVPTSAVQVRLAPPGLRAALQPVSGICLFEEGGISMVAWADQGRNSLIAAAQRTVKAAQVQLRARGAGELPADGLLGPMTRQAVARFQQQNGLQPTGELDEWTLYLLEAADAAAR
jgi:general secretion pathway protein A